MCEFQRSVQLGHQSKEDALTFETRTFDSSKEYVSYISLVLVYMLVTKPRQQSEWKHV
jgi:hypothetical protein